MGGLENYDRNPGRRLEGILQACLWEQIAPGIWEKSRSRLYVDSVGIFLYRKTGEVWVRIYGLSHSRITASMLRERVIFFPDFKLDLHTGD